ncbi:hypothetical protein [Nocardiopsis nanhaiensis]
MLGQETYQLLLPAGEAAEETKVPLPTVARVPHSLRYTFVSRGAALDYDG